MILALELPTEDHEVESNGSWWHDQKTRGAVDQSEISVILCQPIKRQHLPVAESSSHNGVKDGKNWEYEGG